VGDIDFKVISAAESSNKFQKTRFWKEKSVENMVTLEGLPCLFPIANQLFVFKNIGMKLKSSFNQ
jgi:hypothetical protein